MTRTDTIAAVSTARGRGGIGIVRISGDGVPRIARAILGKLPLPRVAARSEFSAADGTTIDSGIALYFPAPRSYTGEDVLELQGHGGRVVLGLVLARVLALGARIARPGEFTERAFLNDKMDLTQAEAVADLIDSQTEAAARAAQRSLRGEFSAHVRRIVEELVELRTWTEAAIDFPTEEVDFLEEEDIGRRLASLLTRVEETVSRASRGVILQEGLSVAIVGDTNVGKSSVLNRLAGEERAIVTSVPGTTRDLVSEHIEIDGLPIRVLDTAGLRETDDIVELEGINRARGAMREAGLILLVVDDRGGITETARAVAREHPQTSRIVVRNKIDLSRQAAGTGEGELGPEVRISALCGDGLGLLCERIKQVVGLDQPEAAYLARRRHLDALGRGLEALRSARCSLTVRGAGELLAEDLRSAQRALSEITGELSTEDLLARIFASFCIGK